MSISSGGRQGSKAEMAVENYSVRRLIPIGFSVGHYITIHYGILQYSMAYSCASVTHFPPIVLTVAASSPFSSNAAVSSPPPMLRPPIRTLGTVRRPVLSASKLCSSWPIGCLSSSTTYGAGTMVYLSTRMDLARAL